MTVGGDKLDCTYATVLPAGTIIESKFIVNSVTPDHKKYNSKFCAIYIKDFAKLQVQWVDDNMKWLKTIEFIKLDSFNCIKTVDKIKDLSNF